MAEQLALLEQYNRIKSKHKNEILFFRLGDFYEMFYHDATEASSILDLTLTHRGDAPMCGVPHHAAKNYISRLLKAGKKIAICEQLTPPGKGKGIIERGVIEVLTPGSVVDDDYLETSANNYIVSFGIFGSLMALSYADISTGAFFAESFDVKDTDSLHRKLYSLNPKEILVMESSLENSNISQIINENQKIVINRYPDWAFSNETSVKSLCKHFGTKSLKGFGFVDQDPAVTCAGMLFDYLCDSSGTNVKHIEKLTPVLDEDFVIIDEYSQKNMEICRNLRDGGTNYSLFGVVNYTKTAMGSRELNSRLLSPLRDSKKINCRLQAVEYLYKDQRLLEKVRNLLSSCRDLERLSSRIAMERANPRDLIAVRDTINSITNICNIIPKDAPKGVLVCSEKNQLECICSIRDRISLAIIDEPDVSPGDGNVIKELWNKEFDEYKELKNNAHKILSDYLEKEKTETGLSSLKIKYNRVSGYYIELPKVASQSAPEHFIRRQTLTNGVRFTTSTLAELESEILGADEKIQEAEKRLFEEFVSAISKEVSILFSTSKELASLDVSSCLAFVATSHGYTKPIVDDSEILEIKNGRHPVVESYLPDGDFVSNSLELDGQNKSFALITGPNMAGKSTFLRQNALIVLLAQAGSFVPASFARIGTVDRIFCRVGAQDNLARGESTFLLEMHETAGILNNATEKSLVIMDEVGRGTSTLDGLSIARAVCEYVIEKNRSRTLFATHYHELTSMKHERLIDLSMLVEEKEGEVVFMKKVVPGCVKSSYGIHVARLAGVPDAVIQRATEIKSVLEQNQNLTNNDSAISENSFIEKAKKPKEAMLFSNEDLVLTELRSINVNDITPLEALNRLSALKKSLDS